ncbi:MAG: hypothetical protein R3E64_17510 [Halioglobus sp.]
MMPLLEHGKNQFIFAAKVLIQGRFGDAGFGQDPIDTGGVIAVLVEQTVGRVNKVLSAGLHAAFSPSSDRTLKNYTSGELT